MTTAKKAKKTTKKAPVAKKKATTRRKPTREEVLRAALDWSAKVSSTIHALIVMLHDTEHELARKDTPFASLIDVDEVGEVRNFLEDAITVAAALYPENVLDMRFSTPGETLLHAMSRE